MHYNSRHVLRNKRHPSYFNAIRMTYYEIWIVLWYLKYLNWRTTSKFYSPIDYNDLYGNIHISCK